MPDEPDQKQSATTPYGVLLSLVRDRTSCRRYDGNREVPRHLIEQCVEAARCAPSACNRQPWRFVVIDEPECVARCRHEARKRGIPHPWWSEVPVFVALCARRDLLTHRIAPLFSGIPYYLIDMGIAGEHFVLAAQSLGLGTCWIGWFREKPVKKLLGIPRRINVVSLITLGWPLAETATTEDTQTVLPLNRRPLDAILDWNQWQG